MTSKDGAIYQCSLCDKGFTTKGSMKRHEQFHKEEKRFACSLCPKKFHLNFLKEVHEEIHNP